MPTASPSTETEWQEEPPTTPGWYWLNDGYGNFLVYEIVPYKTSSLYKLSPKEAAGLDCGGWAGPIEPPPVVKTMGDEVRVATP